MIVKIIFILIILACSIVPNFFIKKTILNINSKSDLSILFLSDLHTRISKYNATKILKAADEVDIVLLGGDTLDRKFNGSSVINMLYSIEKPIYYVLGNHEVGRDDLIEKLDELAKRLEYVELKDLAIYGVDDPLYDTAWTVPIVKDKNKYNILVSHRPEYLDKYKDYDLALTGHAHGGQVRLPIIGGLFAPHQGFFPKYTKGMYKNTFVSTGATTKIQLIVPRIFNRPEYVIINLKNS
ncbi:MAG: metallophosphoesterase [Firmicutes bacterium]|nr:metallophosphoesterase [Bacillota bacterium]